MGNDIAVQLARHALQTAFWIGAPMLAAATLVALLINVGQVMTSIQDMTVSTVPRLAAVAAVAFVLTPWMLHKLSTYTLHLFSDFRPFIH
ncbi:MAG: flagellar biosynthetic protein FliQ [Terriglobales bacterium]